VEGWTRGRLNGREPEGAGEERRHLFPGQRPVRAIPRVVRRVATSRDPGPGQGVDVIFETVSVVVDEPVIGRGRKVECPTHQGIRPSFLVQRSEEHTSEL